MFQRIQDQLQWRADLLMAERYEDLSRDYLFPLAVYLEDHLISVQSAEDAVTMVAELHAALRPRAIQSLMITVLSVELPRNGRFRVWGRWRGVIGGLDCGEPMDVIYYMRQTAQGYQTEMLHYPKVGQCDLRNYNPALRLHA